MFKLSTVLAAVGAAKAWAQAPFDFTDPSPFNVEWTTITTEPGKTTGGLATYQGGMPLGNGAYTVLAWANVSAGGIGLYLGHQNSMSSFAELFKMGLVQVALTPNPFSQGTFFNQTLDLLTATVDIYAGGTSMSDYQVKLSAWVDANADVTYVDIASRDPSQLYSLTASVTSTRPGTVWNYTPAFGFCHELNTQPDVYVDPIPGPAAVQADAAGPSFRHASRDALPSRRLRRGGVHLPGVASFQAGSVITYHRNQPSDGFFINETLAQQGIPELVATTPDHWQDLTAGFVLDAGAGPALQRADAHTLRSPAPAASFQLRATALAVQTDSAAEWLTELGTLVSAVSARGGPDDVRRLHEAEWDSFWDRSYIVVNASCGTACKGYRVSQAYTNTRYVQGVQSRAPGSSGSPYLSGTIWPIKFNGMAFIAAMGSDGEPDFRAWGPSNWWQNTRLPYGAMLPSGDYQQMAVVLEYYLNIRVFLEQRTQAYWGHSGMWTAETHTLFGSYSAADYGCPGSRDGYPTWLMQSGWLHLDWAGDSGTGEYPIMALDYYGYTGDARYLPIAFSAADFLRQHFANRSADGKVLIYPAQVLETWWCSYDVKSGEFVNCCENDTPTVSAMMTLFEKLQALPDSLTTAQQRAEWAAFVPLIPPLPLSADNTTILPAAVLSSGAHNDEGPELYSVHPHRVFTVGRQVAAGRDLTAAINTLHSVHFYSENQGWNYGINDAALLGVVDMAASQLLERATEGPAGGYRFPFFAPHNQDFDPSSDQYGNMNRALQEMLLQSGDDGFEAPTIVLLPAWPCEWDVAFKLVAPLNTTITAELVGGKLASFTVSPPQRAADVRWARCVNSTAAVATSHYLF